MYEHGFSRIESNLNNWALHMRNKYMLKGMANIPL